MKWSYLQWRFCLLDSMSDLTFSSQCCSKKSPWLLCAIAALQGPFLPWSSIQTVCLEITRSCSQFLVEQIPLRNYWDGRKTKTSLRSENCYMSEPTLLEPGGNMASASSIIWTEDQRIGEWDGPTEGHHGRIEKPCCIRTKPVATSMQQPWLCSGLETSSEEK